MSLIFKPENHEYISVGGENIQWTSVTSFISQFKPHFDAKSQAAKSAKNRKSKWYGMSEEEILNQWAAESSRATGLGTWYHNQRESDICELESIQKDGIDIPIYRPIQTDGIKYAPEQKLKEGIYPEHLVYLKSVGLCGQSDLVEVIKNKINITDYKTNKEIKTAGYKNWEGKVAKMLPPVNHLEDCHLNHYALQLSLYMYMMLKHNLKLQPGELKIHHILFEEVGKDKFGYPITARDMVTGDPIVKDVVIYDLPYLKSEVVSMIHYKQEQERQKRAA